MGCLNTKNHEACGPRCALTTFLKLGRLRDENSDSSSLPSTFVIYIFSLPYMLRRGYDDFFKMICFLPKLSWLCCFPTKTLSD